MNVLCLCQCVPSWYVFEFICTTSSKPESESSPLRVLALLRFLSVQREFSLALMLALLCFWLCDAFWDKLYSKLINYYFILFVVFFCRSKSTRLRRRLGMPLFHWTKMSTCGSIDLCTIGINTHVETQSSSLLTPTVAHSETCWSASRKHGRNLTFLESRPSCSSEAASALWWTIFKFDAL